MSIGLGVLLAGAVCAGLVWSQRLERKSAALLAELLHEQTTHNATRLELAAMSALLDRERQSANALRASLTEALDRESAAADAARARKKILDGLRVEQRPDYQEVVDDATRATVADRLNRPL